MLRIPVERILYTLLLTSLASLSSGQIITTVAGHFYTSGTAPGDGGPAVNAFLGGIYRSDVAFDAAGNMYITENSNNAIRKVDVAGIITTIAGTGTLGYTGDGGPAVNALIYHPSSIVVDINGNIIFADQNGGVLRQIDPSGIITTISGPYAAACAGDGVPLSQAVFTSIDGLSTDNAGNIYVADQACNTVRKISTSRIVTTVAGNNTTGFSGDGGPATSAQLDFPCKVGIDNTGNLYIPDARNHRIRKVSTSGIITTIGGDGVFNTSGDGGPASAAEFAFPNSINVDNTGNIYVAENIGYAVRKIDPTGIVTDYAGNYTSGYSGDGGPANLAQVTEIENTTLDAAGNLYIVDADNQVIRKVTNCPNATFPIQPAAVSLCNTGNATFTVSATNANSLQWQINSGAGWSALTDNGVYSGSATNTLQVTGADPTWNNDQFRCVATNGCGNNYSIPVALTVLTPVAPTILIGTSPATICAGANAVFIAEVTHQGVAPTYQWTKDNNPVGTNSPTYSDAGLVNGDFITCYLTSTATCLTTSNATSNTVTMSVDPVLTPAVTITPSANDICTGTPVIFTADPVNAGSGPTFQWYKNTQPAGTNSATYSDNTLKSGDFISCTLASTASCLTSPDANSNTVTMNVTPLATPSIVINTTTAPVCDGSPVDFTTTILDGGATPGYQWLRNNTPIGVTTPGFTDNNAKSGDQISCVLTSDAACLATSSATSVPVTESLVPNPVVTLDQDADLCAGGSRVLDPGNYSSYLWSDGSTGETLTITTQGTYSVTVTDKNGCKGAGSTTISTILPSPANFLPADTSMCSYGSIEISAAPGYTNYEWSDNTSGSTITITHPGSYWLEVTDANNCTGRDTIEVAQKTDCMEGFFAPNAFTPNNDGRNDYFKPLLFGNVTQYRFAIFNRWGQAVFESTNPTVGWDGTLNEQMQPAGTFVWICTYQFAGGPPTQRKGTVILIR